MMQCSGVIFPTDVLMWLMAGVMIRLGQRLSVFRSQKADPWWMWHLFLVYVGIALLDSVHIFPKGMVLETGFPRTPSVLDWLYRSVLIHPETSYSAPFSFYLLQPKLHFSEGILHRVPEALQLTRPLLLPDQWHVFLKQFFGLGLGCGLLWAALKRWPRYQSLFFWISVLWGLGWWSTHIHVLGTNQIGQDVAYLCLKSIRTSLVLAFTVVLLTTPLAVFLGMLAGYYRGWVDALVQFVYVTVSAVPGILLIAVGTLSLQLYWTHHVDSTSLALRSDLRLLMLCVILGLTSWPGLCRLIRAESLKWRSMDFVAAAQVLGTSTLRIFKIHLLPQMIPLIVMTTVLDLSGLVLAEAVLSYVGVGIDPTLPSFGNLINSARMELIREPMVWWPLASAFFFMLGLVFSLNRLGERLRRVWVNSP